MADAQRPPRRQLTLRTRLTAGLLVILLVACAALGLATALALRGFLLSRLDQQLAAAGGRFALSLEGSREDPDAKADVAATDTLGDIPGQSVGTLGVRTKNGKVTQAAVVRDDGQRRAVLSAADTTLLLGLKPGAAPRTVSLESFGAYRVVAVSGRDGDVLVTGLPADSVNDTLARLGLIEAVLFAVVIVVAGVVATVFIRSSLRPLRKVAATALEVSRLPLATGEVDLPDPVVGTDPHTEVGQVREAFNHMLEHVGGALTTREATEARLRRFIADASHELRTPLAGIRSNAELARRQADPDPEVVRRSLARIESEADRMGHVVDDLLLLARLDSGVPLMHEDVDLTRIVLDLVGDQRLASPDHRWVLDLPDAPVHVTGDSHRVNQIVGNLLANARMHTPSGTTVLARVTATEDGGDGRGAEALLVVQDDGPGIPEPLQHTVFERFVRGDDSRSRAAGSTGLGLAIVSAVVHASGGEVDVASRPGLTAFTVRLPLAADQDPRVEDEDEDEDDEAQSETDRA